MSRVGVEAALLPQIQKYRTHSYGNLTEILKQSTEVKFVSVIFSNVSFCELFTAKVWHKSTPK